MMIKHNSKGFTLVELCIALAISTLVMASIYSAYQAQLKSHITQKMVVEMHQNARAAMFAMESEIRMAGYDPTGKAGAAVLYAADTHLAFTSDQDESGVIASSPSVVPEEMIQYFLAGGHLGRQPYTLPVEATAENIEVLNFVYLDEDGQPLGPTPMSFPDPKLALIRSIQVTLIAKSGSGANPAVLMLKRIDNRTYLNQQGDQILVNPDDEFRRLLFTTDVKCRNLG
jgi:type IV pilus assembly protein PilW